MPGRGVAWAPQALYRVPGECARTAGSAAHEAGGLLEGDRPWTILAILLGATGAAYLAVDMPDAYRTTLALAIGLNLIVLSMKWPRAAALAVLFFLPFLGLVRRLLIFEVPWTGNDPLLLVGPVVALFLSLSALRPGGPPVVTDLLSKLVLGIVALGVLQVANPFALRRFLANLGGLIFLAVPLLWFFIGRVVADDASVSFRLQAVVVVALVVGLYGVFQTEWTPGERLPAWDQEWFEVAGYSALTVADSAEANNTVRAFSTFPRNGEYSNYLAIGFIVIFALALHRRFWPVLIAPFLAVAIFYSGGRATMALTGLAVVFLIGMRTRNGPLRRSDRRGGGERHLRSHGCCRAAAGPGRRGERQRDCVPQHPRPSQPP